MRIKGFLFGTTAAIVLAQPAYAQRAENAGPESDQRNPLSTTAVDQIVVTAARGDTSLAQTPRAVRVVSEDTIDYYAEQSGNLSETLSKAIPGFGLPVFQNSLRSLTLRGREALFLLDGVPIQSNSGFFAELGAIDPATIGRIEVLYGPSALYGRGATGGIIQFFTREAAPEGFAGDVAVTGRTDLASEAFAADSLSARVAGGISFRSGDFDGLVRVGFDRLNGTFQPDGQRIAPTNIDESDRWSVFTKLGYGTASTGRLEGWFLRQSSNTRNFDFRGVFNGESAVAVPVPNPVSYEQVPSQDTLAASVVFRHDDLLGGRLRLQGYYRESELVQVASDLRANPVLPPTFPRLFQTNLDTDETGARVDFALPVSDRFEVAVGGDWSKQFNSRPLFISSVPVLVATGEFDAAIRTVQTPTFDLDSLGAFAQLTWKPTANLSVVGGLRWDRFDYQVEPYDVVFGTPGLRPGGDGSADGTSWNIGATFEYLDDHSVFASYAQGFSIPELGFAANSIQPGVPISGSGFIAPVQVESFEAGLRGGRRVVRYSLSGFFARSDDGASATVNPATGIAELVRAPQRNYGFEASVDVAPSERFDAGVAIAWNDGENDANNDGVFLPLGSVQIPPLTISTTASWRPVDRLELTGQVLFAGDRDRAREARVDSFEIRSYTTVDLGARYRLGWGDLALQVTNLLNALYLPVESQSRFGGTVDRRFAAPGRVASLTLSANF
ncbi:TonB-dependent receptor [Oscillatoria laete-virens NRMC-F 0139]|nr:TonB-dependent receptor [Oscillatoria laete-virens]MDL5054800.1 TonB-dependent receptor [Oscillatoria laete-virens NRMC-F 0139]